MSKDKNITWHEGKITYSDRCKNLNQKGLVVWFTGLSGSGKSTIAVEVEKILIQKGYAAFRLDGDNVRHGLNSDLGFTEEERNENIRRISEVAALFKNSGIITLVSFISPYKEMRKFAREKAGDNHFIEVYVKASLKTCEKRDPKDLYKMAKKGEIDNFTGISAPYEKPENPEIILDTEELLVDEAAEIVFKEIVKKQN